MATAAQLRARKEFSRIMKSGGFAKSKTKRRKNPVGRSGANDRQSASTADDGRYSRALSGAPRRKRNPTFYDSGYGGVGYSGTRRGLGRSGSGTEISKMTSGANPRNVRAMNPTRAPNGFDVYEARHGVKGKHIACFHTKADAVEYAKAWSAKYKCPAAITGKGV